MKSMIKRTVMGTAIALSVGAANAANLFIDPATATVAPGGTFNATVRGNFTSEFNQGFTDGSFSVTWDTSQVSLVTSGFNTETSDQFFAGAGSIVPSPIEQVNADSVQIQINNCDLFSCGVAQTITDTDSPADGYVDIYDLEFLVLQTADISLGLATFNFPSIGDTPGSSWKSGNINTITISSRIGATVTVNEVPLPAAVWLFGTGLLGLAGIARRRNPAEA